MKSAWGFAVAIAVGFRVATAAQTAGGDQEAVRAVLEAQEAAWNRGDIDGFMDGYARSRTTTFVSGTTTTRGWKTVRDRYRKKYATREQMGRLTFSDVRISVAGREQALAKGKWMLRRKTDTPHGRFKLWLKHGPDGWRIVRDETS